MTSFKDQPLGQIPAPVGSTNRGRDTVNDTPTLGITLEMINANIMRYINDVIIPTVDDNGNTLPVPVVYGTPELWATVRQFGALRDGVNDKLLTPRIVLERKSVKQGSIVNPNNKYMYTTVTREWNPRNAYDKFAVQNRIQPSQAVRRIMIPDYMDLTYHVQMFTEYQTQMDQLIEQFNVENFEFWGNRNQFKFRVSFDEFKHDNTLPASKDRMVSTTFEMKVAAYLLPDRFVSNQKLGSTQTETYTAKKVVAFTEVVSDVNDPRNKINSGG